MTTKNGSRILIVDDLLENLQIIAKALEPQGYDMRFAEGGAKALAMAKETAFDLILLDVMMPDMSGFEVCRELKQDPRLAKTPVIFITAKTDAESIVAGFEVGGVDYVTKPFRLEELRARVGTHIALHRRERELQQFNATKDKFISIVAHELKIPMGGIRGFVALLNEQFERFSIADIRENIRLIKDGMEGLYNLIENLLDWSNLQVGLIPYRRRELELQALIDQVVRQFDNDAKAKRIAWDVRIPAAIEASGDLEMVETIVRNLISNAVKFGREKGWVRVRAEERERDVLITVADDGCGISEQDRRKLFRLDAEVKRRGTHGELGTGMGLILAKEYVECHGGEIWLDSELERGTAVFFTLPKAVPPHEEPPHEAQS